MVFPRAAPLLIGTAANLLHGYRLGWSESKDDPGYFSPPTEPFVTFPVEQTPPLAVSDTTWREPELSLHANAQSLLGAIFDYRVLPFAPHSPDFDIPSGALLLPPERRDRTLTELGARVGIDLAEHDATGGGFVLVKMRRVVAEHMHEAVHSGISRHIRVDRYWTAQAKHAMARLRVARRIVRGTDREAGIAHEHVGRYLDYFYRFGTHFVSRMELGGLLLQIFAVQPRRLQALCDLLKRETGSWSATGAHALGFRSYLGPDWMSQRGRLVSVGEDPALTASLAAGEWHEPRFARGDSLLAPRTPAITRALRGCFSSPAPITVYFSPQSVFMEVFRADAWKRLLRGALLQRFGPGLRIPPARRTAVPAAALSISTRTCRTPTNFVSFAPVAVYRAASVVSLPAPQVWLGAYQVDVMAHATGLPVLRLEQATFENFEFATGAMNDALCVTEADGRRRETLCELFRFATRADEGELPRIVVRAAPSPEALQPMAEAMARTGFWVHALRWHPCGTEFARGFFEWMAGILRDDPTRQAARVRALGLVRLIDLGISSLSQVDPRKLLGLCQDIVALASRSPRERDAAEAGANPVPGPGAADFAGMAARAEELLGDAVAATALRENCAALRAAVDEAFARLRGVIAAPTTDAASRSPAAAQALLAALSQLVAATPTQCRAPLPFDGDAPVARFWRIVFAIRQTEAAIRAIELATAGQPLLALAWLAPLDQQVTPPSAEDWQALPALMAESAGREAQAPIAASWLEALRHVLEAEQAWLARRGQLAFLALENSSCPAGDEHSVSSAAADSPLRLEWEQARLVRALLRLNVAWTKSSGRPALPDTLDLLDIALVLREQARVAAGIQATTSSRVNASET